MSNATKSSPPVFEEGVQSWKDYKKELMMWKTLTSLDEAKLGPALYLSLKGKSKEVIKDIGIEEIAVKGGLDKIVSALDSVYKKDENQEAYLAYKTFEEFKRPKDMKVKDYLIKFESLHTKLKSLHMKLPEGVKAYRLLHSASMSDEEIRLCLATIKEFKYDDMKTQLMKICGDEVSCSVTESVSSLSIKEEPVFLTESNYRSNDERRIDTEPRFIEERNCDQRRSQTESDTNETYYTENNGNRSNYNRNNRWNNRSRNNRGNRRNGGGSVRGRGFAATPRKETNPINSDGEVYRCSYCGSKFHFRNSCPEIDQNPQRSDSRNTSLVGICEHYEKSEEINLYNVLQTSANELDGLIGETIGMAVIDSGCSKTVTGKEWLDLFKETLSENEVNNLAVQPSHQLFKFGEGNSIQSEGKVKLPAIIGSRNVTIETEIIQANIPMLLSKEAMKKAETIINFNTDEIEMMGESHQLVSTKSGHYAIPLTSKSYINDSPSEYNVTLLCEYIDEDLKNPKKIADKLHRQFCHCSPKKLKQLISNSRLWKNDKDLLEAVDQVSESCQICKRYKKSPSIPAVGLPLASKFMDCVAMDLFVVKGKFILHLIDVFTRYSVAVVRNSKNQNSIVDAILKAWISYFGKPAKFIADNGGEFDNESYKDMCDMLDIEILKTAAYSPWSNGLCERHNGVLKESIKKTIEDSGCSVETATAWATSAKNSLCNYSGYSANQMILGMNPSFPSILNDKLPALSSSNDIAYTVEENLKAMRLAREACVQAESSEKLKMALRSNVPSYNNDKFENGQKVYYKRKDTRWSGPAVVIGSDGKTIIVKHGGEIVRVHISRLIHVDKCAANVENYSNKQEIDNKENTTTTEITETRYQIEDDSDGESEMNEGIKRDSLSVEETHASNDKSDQYIQNEIDNTKECSTKSYPDIKSKILYKTSEQQDWKKGVVISRAGKVGKDKKGKHKAKYNIQDVETNQINHYDFDSEVCEWKPVSSDVLLTNVDKAAKANAKSIELQNWKINNVYSEVNDDDQYAITTRWITTTKEIDGNFVVKARLVARGFEDIHNQGKNDSPTCSKDSLRIALTIMASKKWECMSLDNSISSKFSVRKRNIFSTSKRSGNRQAVEVKQSRVWPK